MQVLLVTKLWALVLLTLIFAAGCVKFVNPFQLRRHAPDRYPTSIVVFPLKGAHIQGRYLLLASVHAHRLVTCRSVGRYRSSE